MDPKLRELIKDWIEHTRKNNITTPDIADVRSFLSARGFESPDVEKAISASGASVAKAGAERRDDVPKPNVKVPKGVRQASDGNYYQWMGSQWAKYNPATGKAGQMAKKEIGQELSKQRQEDNEEAAKKMPDVEKASDGNFYKWMGAQWAKYDIESDTASQMAPKDIQQELTQKREEREESILQQDDVEKASDGNFYKWLGAQWARYNPATGKTSQMASREIAQELGDPNEQEEPEDDGEEENEQLSFSDLTREEQDLYSEISKVIAKMSRRQRKNLAAELKK